MNIKNMGTNLLFFFLFDHDDCNQLKMQFLYAFTYFVLCIFMIIMTIISNQITDLFQFFSFSYKSKHKQKCHQHIAKKTGIS